MRAKNIQVGVCGNRETIKVWCLSFNLHGLGMKYNGNHVDEAHRKKVEQKIAAAIAAIDFTEDV